MALEKELETYRRELPSLLERAGRFVVIFGEEIIGDYGDYEDAVRAGYQKCGFNPFLVKKIEAVDTIRYFTRDLPSPCRT